ncbi:MAG: NADH-quinone oxidoreductase subunit NuoE [candidate division Zixibacteria bacterium]|nr:NADH-quinone oxidoreductase subunit NuoE [candidate division Zixibacteria bacterium]
MILTAESVAAMKQKAAEYPQRKSAILPCLTIACQQVGHLNESIYREIAKVIHIPYVEIAEAATFYTLFPKKPVGKHLIQVCHNISCALVGADNMIGYLEEKLNIKKGETTPDNKFTLISVECLGSCSTAPMVQVNDEFYENLTRVKVDQVIEELKTKN